MIGLAPSLRLDHQGWEVLEQGMDPLVIPYPRTGSGKDEHTHFSLHQPRRECNPHSAALPRYVKMFLEMPSQKHTEMHFHGDVKSSQVDSEHQPSL